MRRTLPAVLLAACASMKPPNATEPLDAREGAVTPSDRQLGSRTLPGWPQSASDGELRDLLVAKHGEAQHTRIERGLKQVAAMWRPQDGDDRARRAFVEQWFESDPRKLSALLGRFEYALEQVDGYFLDIGRELRRWSELELGPELPIDEQFAGLDLSAHSPEDLFQSKLAFVALLNFPLPTLDEMLAQAGKWSREEWAAVRLTRRFALRPSGEALQARARASAAAEAYIAGYNLWMHHVLTRGGTRLFPKGVRLISHWNLRDQIKAEYGEPDKALALERQRLIRTVMEQIVVQTIPRSVIDDPRLDWYPDTGRVTAAPAEEIETEQMSRQGKRPAQAVAAPDREEDKRYAVILEDFRAARRTDADSPLAPTEIDRRFQFDREIPEARVKQLLESIAGSRLAPRVAALIRKRLGRPLEPHDVWYSGFLARAKYPEAELSRLTRAKYPTAAAYKKDIPRLLEALNFSPERARFFDSHIVVDPARGAGHAMPSARRGDDPHLRTRVNPDGMDYKGYNIAVHEMGHNVEQICSTLCPISWTTRSSRESPTPPSPRRWRSPSRTATWSSWDSRSPMSGASGCACSTISGRRGRSAAWRWSTWRCGAGCTRTRTPGPSSFARRPSGSRATFGTATTRPCWGGRARRSSPSTRTWSARSSTCRIIRSVI